MRAKRKNSKNRHPLAGKDRAHPAFWVKTRRVKALLDKYERDYPESEWESMADACGIQARVFWRIRNLESEITSFEVLDAILTGLDMIPLARVPAKEGGFADVYEHDVIMKAGELEKQTRKAIKERRVPRIGSRAVGWIVEGVVEGKAISEVYWRPTEEEARSLAQTLVNRDNYEEKWDTVYLVYSLQRPPHEKRRTY